MTTQSVVTVFPLTDPSQVGEARRHAAALARELGFDETQGGQVAIVASEAATNIVRHGAGGELHVRGTLAEDGAPATLELVALDKGPGIPDMGAAMRDGFSTGGTAGGGLGAIERLSTSFDIYSTPAGGTALLARFAAPRAPAAEGGWLRVGVTAVPHPAERVCGDAWATEMGADRALLMIADGLGHGQSAADAAQAAVRTFREHRARTLPAIVQSMHAALRGTRGAAVGVAEVDRAAGLVRFAGVGNIAAAVLGAGVPSRSLISYNGIVGHEMRKVQEVSVPWARDAVLVMHSDGLQTSWKLDRYPGLVRHDPTLAAAVLYRDYTRGRDDVTVLVAREDVV
ncbi:MAG TPA: ATP-binding protein [Gemmatimonadaceae bacterium]|nr:ATP-binding protein [Gemmatimonadaceae bacterium]